MWQELSRMFQRPALAIALAALAGLGIESVVLRLFWWGVNKVVEFFKWACTKAWEYWTTIVWVTKWASYLAIGCVLGIYFFTEPISENTAMLNTLLDYRDIALVLTKDAIGAAFETGAYYLKRDRHTEVLVTQPYKKQKRYGDEDAYETI